MESNNEKEIRARSKQDPSSDHVEQIGNLQNNLHQQISIDTKENVEEKKCEIEARSEVVRSEESEQTNESEEEVRQSWQQPLDFLIALLGFAVGLGNVWRFPYLCFQHGGGAFLIPYFLFMICCGAPLFFLEISLGQFTRQGAIRCWDILPIFKGIGLASTLVVFYCNTYYIVILAWAAFYLFSSFLTPLEFSKCNNPWNTPNNCFEVSSQYPTEQNLTSSSDEFWERRVLQSHLSAGLDDPGQPILHLVGCLFFIWTLCFLCIFKGIRVSGKIVYFTALFPYLVLACLLIRGVTLPGSWKGIEFYLKPDFSKLSDSQVWLNAGTQVFFSYAVCLGVLPTLGSFNKFNNNVLRDALIISVANPATSIFAGFGVFSILGHLAHMTGKDIHYVTESGPGLVFKVYPIAISLLPGSNFWSILFFFMIILLGFDSQFSAVEAFITSISDVWPRLLRGRPSRRMAFTLLVCVLHFVIGLTMITNGGIYMFGIWDRYSASGKNLLLIALLECVVIMFVYGRKQYRSDIVRMLGYDSLILTWFEICWCIITPVLVTGLFAFEIFESITDKREWKSGDYVYPDWAFWIGYLFMMTVFLCLPGYAFYHVMRAYPSSLPQFKSVLRTSIVPKIKQTELREDSDEDTSNNGIRPLGSCEKILICSDDRHIVNFGDVPTGADGNDTNSSLSAMSAGQEYASSA